MRKKGYSFPLSLSHFSYKNNESARFFDKLLSDFSLCSFPMRTHFDNKKYSKKNFYGAAQYFHVPKLKDFWEDYVDENEVFRRIFIWLTLGQMLNLNVAIVVPRDIIDDNSDFIDASYHNVILPAFQWPKNVEVVSIKDITSQFLDRSLA